MKNAVTPTIAAIVIPWQDYDWIGLEFPDDPEFLVALKAMIPDYYRSWDGEEERWLFEPEWKDKVVTLAEKHFDYVEEESEGS